LLFVLLLIFIIFVFVLILLWLLSYEKPNIKAIMILHEWKNDSRKQWLSIAFVFWLDL